MNTVQFQSPPKANRCMLYWGSSVLCYLTDTSCGNSLVPLCCPVTAHIESQNVTMEGPAPKDLQEPHFRSAWAAASPQQPGRAPAQTQSLAGEPKPAACPEKRAMCYSFL